MNIFKRRLLPAALLGFHALIANASIAPTPEETPLVLIDPQMMINGLPVQFDPTSQTQQYANAGKSVEITLGYLPRVVAKMTEIRVYDESGGGGIDAVGNLTYQVAVTSKSSDPIFVSVTPKQSYVVESTIWPSVGGSAQGAAGVFFMMRDVLGQVVNFGMECGRLYATAYYSRAEDCANPEIWPDIEPFHFMMLPNTPYSVTLEAFVQAETSPGNQIFSYAYIDPIFAFVTDAPEDATFIYSPGVTHYVAPTNQVPEPATGTLVATAVGLMARRRKP